MTWKAFSPEIEGHPLPDAAPFDGNPVLIKTAVGIVEAWWQKGEKSETLEGTEYSGYCWICYDDAFQHELGDALAWMPIPQGAP